MTNRCPEAATCAQSIVPCQCETSMPGSELGGWAAAVTGPDGPASPEDPAKSRPGAPAAPDAPAAMDAPSHPDANTSVARATAIVRVTGLAALTTSWIGTGADRSASPYPDGRSRLHCTTSGHPMRCLLEPKGVRNAIPLSGA